MPALIEARSLTKNYGAVLALDSINLEVHEGITGLLGPNGAGKSTAIKLFLGLLQPTSGAATVLGEESHRSVSVRSRLGYMPEHDCLPPQTAAAEFLAHMAEVSGLPPKQARTRAADILRHVGLAEERYRLMGEYSTGMQQRVKLAQTLVHDPVLIFLDEPTAGLDPTGRIDMLSLIRRTGRDFGISILLSSHLMNDVEQTCNRIIVIDGGRVTTEGEVSRFTEETQTLVIEVDENRDAFLKALAARNIEAAVESLAVIVEQKSDEDYDAIRDALVEADAPLRRLAPRQHALTEIFRDARP